MGITILPPPKLERSTNFLLEALLGTTPNLISPPTKCINCGASLKQDLCEFCGTKYNLSNAAKTQME